ncbi:MAG: carboxypeptidase-like regulatory domain-containing protein, partial [Flavobacteriales bacterium]
MKKTIKIQIPEPCHENWYQMTPTEQGKFCKVCTKEVLDFTQITDEDLVKKVMQGNKLCGRFKASQLDRELKFERKTGISVAPLAASFLLPLTMLATNPSNKNNNNYKMQGKFVSIGLSSLNNNTALKMVITTHGKIKNIDGKPIVDAKISVKESGKTVYSDLNGAYKISTSNDETLIIEKEGFKTKEIKLGRKSSVQYVILLADTNHIKNKGKVCDIKLSSTTKGKPIVLKNIDSISKTKKDSLNKNVSGIITDEAGIPLPGVNIIIKNTNLGTQSDFDGNFTIHANRGQTLVFSYVGFITEEMIVSCDNNNNNNIKLKM